MLQEDIGRVMRSHSTTDVSSDIEKENDSAIFQQEFTNLQLSKTTIDTSFPGSSNQSSENFANGGLGISNQDVLKNIHPSITREKELTDSSSKGLLLKWGSRLELEALNLRQTTKLIMKEVETSRKETNSMITTLVKGLEKGNKMEQSPDSTSKETLQSISKLIKGLSEQVTTQKKLCSCSATFKSLQNDYSTMSKTISSTMKDIKSLDKHLESLEQQAKAFRNEHAKSQINSTKQFEAILLKLEQLEAQTRASQPLASKDDILQQKQSKIVKLKLNTLFDFNEKPAPAEARFSSRKPKLPKRLLPKMRSQTQIRTRSTLNMTDCHLYDLIYPRDDIKVFDFERSRKMKQALNQAHRLHEEPSKVEKRIILDDDVEIGLMSD